MMDLLEKVMHFIEEENYSALKAIYNADLAKLGKCAVISNKGLLAEDVSASSDIPQNDAPLMNDKKSLSCQVHFKILFSMLRYVLLLCKPI